ncbi:unnamed protein product [Nippostrongylus brasiliensis]|uniref:DUF4604 domain-containing protein n=1 Tax=Nippostrongylus brasiliensis TaxID=27835 RepID=A0A158R0G6_NIPBR|nr:unnamed protein product [Nippostrongylus brasiliensis]
MEVLSSFTTSRLLQIARQQVTVAARGTDRPRTSQEPEVFFYDRHTCALLSRLYTEFNLHEHFQISPNDIFDHVHLSTEKQSRPQIEDTGKISTRPSRLDRDCRSMSRTEKTPITGDDEVERTFERLYNRYVRDDDSTAGSLAQENAKIRSFISHSEAEEEDSSEEELSPTEMDDSFAEKLQSLRQRKADTSVTPRGSTRNSPDATPKCSPMMLRKREERPSPSLVEEKTKEQPQKVENKTPAQEFREKHPDLEFKEGGLH